MSKTLSSRVDKRILILNGGKAFAYGLSEKLIEKSKSFIIKKYWKSMKHKKSSIHNKILEKW